MSPHSVVVIGAGAAGLTAAIRAGEAGARVVLLNAHPKIGLKILMSGGTRCNVTHREVTERDFHGSSRNAIARVLRAFTSEQSREWFESLGVGLKLEETGKYFPATDDAQTVLDALLGAVERAGVEVESGARVVRLGRTTGASPTSAASTAAAPHFRIGIQDVGASAAFDDGRVAAHGGDAWELPAVEPSRWLEADRVMLATGGLSFPRTGSDGVGYALVTSLGHTLVAPVPALTPLTSTDALCSTVQGLTYEAELALWVGERVVERVSGSLLVAHFGFSGPAALDLSRHWHRAGEGAAAGARRVTLNSLPGETRESLTDAWVKVAKFNPQVTVKKHYAARVPERLFARLCQEAGVTPGTAMGQVTREQRAMLIERLVARDLAVTGTLGYEKAEVTAGGVPLAEVNTATMESRVCPGLYLCGEILDVEGRLGGFNFQWAWSSGTVAGRAAGTRTR
ncbi:MAG: aminoacetone oxidase family FAD-binding enzyme [Candidatus Eisenbacteria bacterium]|uniref:Aminoacetone oxidase family FAD-binding enzyme n=1 Tax=Eiseniibacteriota bacterium TaxID=2212470 RepID=A0A849SEC7_UNCEI|nr:aminoacetone oxidase family FAD-binding enzyme [Candidatus Eisenbacteria bacterium]